MCISVCMYYLILADRSSFVMFNLHIQCFAKSKVMQFFVLIYSADCMKMKFIGGFFLKITASNWKLR